MALHLVTGSSGYLGSFLVRELLRRGEKVRAIDVVEDADLAKQVEFHKIDILDREKVRGVLSGIDVVHHAAALVPLKKSGDLYWRVNVEGTRNLITLARQAAVKHFSHISSSAVFGNVEAKDCPIGLNPDNLHPVEIYGRSKAAAEKVILENPSMMTCSILRPRTIIGPERLGIFQILYEWVHEGRRIYIIGPGDNLFQFVHVDDVVAVSIETAARGLGGFFNIGTDRFDTLRSSLEEFCKKAGTGATVRSLPVTAAKISLAALDVLGFSPLSPWHYLTYHKPYYFDQTANFERLKWRPRYSSVEMLMQSYEWYVDNKNRLQGASASVHRSGLRQGVLKILKAFS